MVVRKFLKVLTVSAALSSTALFAADPGGTVGLAKATFTGSSFDTTSDVMANAAGYVLVPEEMYASSLPAKTTVVWTGYMKMEAGVTYDFKGCYDDYVSVKINGAWILSKGSECQERTGSYVPTATDWYPIEFRVANNGGGGGCQNASQYGILWKKNSESDWRQVSPYDEQGVALFKTGRNDLAPIFKTTPIVLSSKMRENAPTVMDVTYIVCSPHDTVNVRALAFEDGERSFWKVVRPETFVNDPDDNPTAQNIGDNIPANVVHKLAWKVDSDWKTDLAKVKFEILTSDMALLPLKTITIPSSGKNPSFTIADSSAVTDKMLIDAIYWEYANKSSGFINTDGYLDYNNQRWVSRQTLNTSYRRIMMSYFYSKIGYQKCLRPDVLYYARKATRGDYWNIPEKYNAWCRDLPSTLYAGEKGYLVIDVSEGAEAAQYTVSYADEQIVAGWSNEYKKNKIILRKIPAGQYLFQGHKPVTLTHAFYMGVYDITQKQYELVVGNNPTDSTRSDMYPVIASWNTIRGDSAVYDWPRVKAVDPDSFVGKIRVRTGLMFDLPTEAQWEYAARAGTTTLYNNGSSDRGDLSNLALYSNPYPYQVGQYLPNAWGLYDMNGNVGQWCLDHDGSINSDPVVDPITGEVGTTRVVRGCTSWSWVYCASDSGCRAGVSPDSTRDTHDPNQYCTDPLNYYYVRLGFRLCLTLE